MGVKMIKSDEMRRMAIAFRHGRKMNGISRVDAARRLGLTLGELGLIEGGRMMIPAGLFNSLMYHGIRHKCKKGQRD